MPLDTGHDSSQWSDSWRLFSDGADGSRFVWLGGAGFENGAEAIQQCVWRAGDIVQEPVGFQAQGVELEVGTQVQGRLHHHAEFLRRDVLRVRLNFRRAQRSSSAQTSQRFQDFLQSGAPGSLFLQLQRFNFCRGLDLPRQPDHESEHNRQAAPKLSPVQRFAQPNLRDQHAANRL